MIFAVTRIYQHLRLILCLGFVLVMSLLLLFLPQCLLVLVLCCVVVWLYIYQLNLLFGVFCLWSCWFWCVFVCLFVCLLACLFVCLFACLLVCVLTFLLACSLVRLACFFVSLLFCLFVSLFFCFFVCLFVCLFVCALIYYSIYIYTTCLSCVLSLPSPSFVYASRRSCCFPCDVCALLTCPKHVQRWLRSHIWLSGPWKPDDMVRVHNVPSRKDFYPPTFQRVTYCFCTCSFESISAISSCAGLFVNHCLEHK